MEKITIQFEGTHTLVSPAHITMPSMSARNSRFPTGTPTMTVFNGTARRSAPYLTASGDRGLQRRQTSEISRQKSATPWDFHDYNFNLVGGIKGSGKSEPNPMKIAEMRSKNPNLGLWGAGDPFVRGKARIGHLISEHEQTRDNIKGVRRDPFLDGDVPMEEMTEEDRELALRKVTLTGKRAPLIQAKQQIEKINDSSKKTQAEKNEEVSEIIAAIGESFPNVTSEKTLQAEINAINADLKKEGLSDVSTQLPLAGYEIVPKGSILKQINFYDGLTMLELGLMLKGLHRTGLRPFLGGISNHALGIIDRSYTVKLLEGDYYTNLGTFTVKSFEGLIITELPDLFQEAIAAWDAADPESFDFKVRM